MYPELLDNKWFRLGSIAILLTCVAAVIFLRMPMLIALPFAWLYCVLMFVNWKAAWWVLLFSIPASVQIFLAGDSLSTSLPDEPMMWSFLLLFCVLLATNPGIIPKWWWKNPLVLITVLQLVWTIVAVIYSTELLFSVKFLIAKCWFLIAFMIFPVFIFKRKGDFKTAFLLLLIPMVITMAIIVVRHAMTGFHFRKIEKAIGGLYYNHVDYSTVISMFFPVLCMAYPLTKGKPWWLRLTLVLIILFFLPAIYTTYARAAMIAIVFAFALYAAIRMRLANFIMPVFYGFIALVMVYMVRDNKYIDFRPNYEETYMHNSFTDHMIATFRGQDMSSMERIYRWIAAVRMSQDRPITGYGPNSFYYNYKPYAVALFRTYVSRNEERSTTHNYFLYMLVEQGWPAMILYAILVMVVIAQAQKIYHRFDDRFYKYCTMAAIMLFGAAFINNFFSELIETHKVGALFYLSIALLIILDRKSRQIKAGDAVE
jgi:O-antigen ligase